MQNHPFMVGTQFHPEFRSRPDRPHPLFRDFIAAAKARALGEASSPAYSRSESDTAAPAAHGDTHGR
jgi:hypothetical protein